MYLRVTHCGVSLEEPEDTRGLRISLAEPAEDLDRILRASGWGMTDGDDALVDVEVLRRSSGSDDFENMIDFARNRGWLSANERFVRAHVEDETN